MAGVTLDDGGWGAVATNFANALAPDPHKRAQLYLYGANYNKTLQEIEEQRKKMEAIDAAVTNFPNTIPQSATLPDGAVGPVHPDEQRKWEIQRQQRIADNAAATRLAKSASDYAQGVHANRGMGAIAGGIPSGQGQQDVVQAQISSIGGSLPNYSSTPHTYQQTNAAGTPIGAPITSRRLPDGPAALASPVKVGPQNPFENDAASDNRLLQLSQKALRDPGNLGIPEIEEAAVHFANRYGVKNVVSKGADGSTVTTMTREKVWPEVFNPLAAKVAEVNWWRAENEAAQREGRPMRAPPASFMPTIVGPGATPDASVGGLVGGAPAAPGAPGAPGAVPGAAPAAPAPVPTIGGLPVGSNVGAQTQIAAGDASPLRKEFNDQPAVKKYEQAILPYEQFRDNIKVGTPQADISLIYNLAKMLDPESVVREGEMLIWKKSGGPFDQLSGLYDKIVANKAALNPKVRANLADMAERVMGANHAGYKRVGERFTEIATEMGIEPGLIVPKIGELPKIDRKEISTITPAGPGPRGAPEKSSLAPAAAPAAAGARPPGRTIRVNPQTGQIEDVP